MKKIFLLLILIIVSSVAFAIRVEYGNNLVITKPIFEDVYIAGGEITINAPIHGDLVIMGGTITINDTISNDILLIGGKVIFNGFVGDDIRCAGGNIRISKNVIGDVIVTSGEVIIDNGASIGSLMASSGNVTIDGNVNGQLKGFFGILSINGIINNDVECKGRKINLNGVINGKSIIVAREINLASTAIINNDIRYWHKKGTINFQRNIKLGKATFDPSLSTATEEWYFLGAASFIGLLAYLGMAFTIILLIQYLFSSTLKETADTVFNKTLSSLGIGFLYFIITPIIILITFFTIIGIPVGIFISIFYVIIILLATTISSIVASNWFNNRFNKQWKFGHLYFTAFGIFIILKLIALMPIVGWLVTMLCVCISVGAIIITIYNQQKQKSKFISNNSATT
jgi:hypothetical protein